jgi:hypothetical protein
MTAVPTVCLPPLQLHHVAPLIFDAATLNFIILSPLQWNIERTQ